MSIVSFWQRVELMLARKTQLGIFIARHLATLSKLRTVQNLTAYPSAWGPFPVPDACLPLVLSPVQPIVFPPYKTSIRALAQTTKCKTTEGKPLVSSK